MPHKKKTHTPKNPLEVKQKQGKRYWLYAIPLILLCLFLLLSIADMHLKQNIKQVELVGNTRSFIPSDYPSLTASYAPYITANSAIIMDNASQRILYQKNDTFRFSMASTTKVMTALVGLDYFTPRSVLTVQRTGVEGTVVGFQPGERYYFGDVLYGMLLPSGNDAAFTVADNYPGGMERFVAKMNEKAQSFHLDETHYADPAGLNDDNDYTTVVDLARLTSIALRNDTVTSVVDTKERSFVSVDGLHTFTVTNINALLDEPGVTGFKTGHTVGAGDVLITTVVDHTHTFIIIVMDSADRFADTQLLLQYLKQNVTYFKPRLD